MIRSQHNTLRSFNSFFNMRISVRSARFSSTIRDSVQSKAERMIEGVLNGDRLQLARAITLVESKKYEDHKIADALLDKVLAARKMTGAKNCIRLGIAGPPGAGKSSFIETLGLNLVKKCKRVAVISVDPSSVRTGGSILGDKTRMTELSRSPHAFIRACPTSGVLGGIAMHTNSVVLLCQAACYDVIIVETVGLGQSEVEVEQTVDVLTLMLPPANGDDLQGSKKGIIEAADIIVVNKADGDLEQRAKRTAADYNGALHFNRPKLSFWRPPVLLCSARNGTGIDEMWFEVEHFIDKLQENNMLLTRRREQGRYWMLKQLERQLAERALHNPYVQALAKEMETDLANGLIGPRQAAERLVNRFLHSVQS